MEEQKKQTMFERKIKPILHYVGTIGASLMCLAYIVIVIVMVIGFTVNTTISSSILFAIVNAVVGFIIMQFLKVQGIDFARGLPQNKKVIDKYNTKAPKKPRTHSIKYYWITSVIKDVITKCATIALTTVGLIYIVIVGSRDYTMFLLAAVNLIMFVCFGLLALVKAYDFYNEKHIPYLVEQMEAKEAHEKDEAENKKRLEMAAQEYDKQANDLVHSSGGSDLLESCMDIGPIGVDNQSMVLDDNECSDCILGGPVHTSDIIANRIHNGAQETSHENKAMEEK